MTPPPLFFRKVKRDLERSVSEIISGFKDVHSEAEKNRVAIESTSQRSLEKVVASVIETNEKASAHREMIEKLTEKRIQAMELKSEHRLQETNEKLDALLAAVAEMNRR
jgi:hypothetical protein